MTNLISGYFHLGRNEDLFCSTVRNLTCANGVEEVPCYSLCDGRYDCSDNSDEEGNCHYYECLDGNFVSRHSICNNHALCHDSSDELYCDFYPRFVCDDHEGTDYVYRYDYYDSNITAPGHTIARYYTCDGRVDCHDSSDEICYQCETGIERYHRDFICDGVKDCPDGTDEAGCPGNIINYCRNPKCFFLRRKSL